MKFTSTVAAALAFGMTIASPVEVEKRNIVTTPKVNDGIILNYALTLEYLERKFYQEGLAKFSQKDFVAAGFADPFYKNLEEIYVDEQTHVTFLKAGLAKAGVVSTNELEYNFGFKTVKEFVTLASVLEGVGVSAYLGAAASIVNPDYLTAAGAILTVEARHSSYLRAELKESPFPNPFDTPLDFNEVYSLASPFIVGGKSPVALPFKAFPKLTLQSSQYNYVADQSSVTFKGAFVSAKADFKITEKDTVYAVFFSGLQKFFVKVYITGNDYKIEKIPAGVQGQAYVVLSTSDTKVTDEVTIAGPAIIEVYPKGKTPSTYSSYSKSP